MKDKIKKTERIYRDPVCNMQVNYKNAPAILRHEGKTYCFCAEVCRDAFGRNPDFYLRGRKNK